ncbi:hypothetical protein BCY86_02235 [Pajaroellobacter abortibovis]|uniref:Uncharacterized protein n=1 Tax=Pajaroellobacter abortibovis TaxID=1882918 RepID=A0A1L6MVW7_9BACT|nr:hypothetical protein BCY86_02235 [Pajaroellobacter abortibovis]
MNTEVNHVGLEYLKKLNLRVLTLDNLRLEQSVLSTGGMGHLLAYCPNRISITFCSYGFAEEIIPYILQFCPNLTSLWIAGNWT